MFGSVRLAIEPGSSDNRRSPNSGPPQVEATDGPGARDLAAITFWSEQYGRPVSRDELVEVRHNLKRLIGLMRRLEHRNWWSMSILNSASASEVSNTEATLLCRISSDKQAEGYSLDFQEKGGIAYAERKGFAITRTHRIIESAYKDGRVKWEEYLNVARHGPEANILIPRVDRSLRNPADLAIIVNFPKETGKVLHFFDDGIIYHKDSPATDVFNLMIQGAMATFYSASLSQRVKKGMNEKARQGKWPERAPYGYKNDKATKLIEIDPERDHWVRRIKELSAIGMYTLDKMRDILIEEGYPNKQHRLHRNLIERIIRNPIYAGRYEWPTGSGTLIKGIHKQIVPWDLHILAVAGLERLNRPKYSKHEFPFAGLIRCGLCEEQRAVTFEVKKKRFVYGHCTGVRKSGICPDSEYVRQEELEEQFVEILRGVQLSPEMAAFILEELAMESGGEAAAKVTQAVLIKQELGRLNTRIDQAYTDKADGKITEEFWAKKNSEWQLERVCLEEKAKNAEESGPASYLPTARKVLELSKSLEKLYYSANPLERRELLDSVCSNLFLRGKKLEYIYKMPFDLWAEGHRSAKWLRD